MGVEELICRVLFFRIGKTLLACPAINDSFLLKPHRLLELAHNNFQPCA